MTLSHKPDEGYLTGQLLIAMPGLRDARFARTVIYMCAHNEDGAMGLVINRLIGAITFPDLLRQLGIEPLEESHDGDLQKQDDPDRHPQAHMDDGPRGELDLIAPESRQHLPHEQNVDRQADVAEHTMRRGSFAWGPTDWLLPPLLDELFAGGLEAGQIRVLLGTAAHRPMNRDEIERKIGPEIARRHEIVQHDFMGPDLRHLGWIEGGPVQLNRHFLDADLRVCVGGVIPHNETGFGGGSKMVVPGVAGRETIAHFHGALPPRLAGVLEAEPHCVDRRAWSEAVARHADLAIATSDNPRTEDPLAILADVEAGLAGLEKTEPEALLDASGRYAVVVDRREHPPENVRGHVDCRHAGLVDPIGEAGGAILPKIPRNQCRADRQSSENEFLAGAHAAVTH